MKDKQSKNNIDIPKKRCAMCGKVAGKGSWVLFNWNLTPGTNTMTIPPGEIEKRIVGVMCDSCHQIANSIN